ncbi:N utilization substance protein B [Deinobacterium chartae]|uniref:Transcription antitermination protein NusB n=1 Tax=Deinobacterium chartae TaxID=521158 RepID=A0A841I0Q0_9DEIO|nr:transcription antitermination factor NusB [Deinobacterium chartae]MBB6098554.1 N utilization substance protein B [Deinobacterium chartae]
MRRRQQAPSGSRRSAREHAFRVIFEAQQGSGTPTDAWNRTAAAMRDPEDDTYPVLSDEALAFSRQLVDGYAHQQARIDAALEASIEGWTFKQMAQTDLNVLRVATFELLNLDTPAGAVIESAVRIARKFGGDESGRFVHGVLARLLKRLEAGQLERGAVTTPAGGQEETFEPQEEEDHG